MWIQIDRIGQFYGIKGQIIAYGNGEPPIGEDIVIDEVNHNLDLEDYTPSGDGTYNPNGWKPKIE